MAGGGPGSHGSTKQNYDLDQIWGDLREGIEHVSVNFVIVITLIDLNKHLFRSITGIR